MFCTFLVWNQESEILLHFAQSDEKLKYLKRLRTGDRAWLDVLISFTSIPKSQPPFTFSVYLSMGLTLTFDLTPSLLAYHPTGLPVFGISIYFSITSWKDIRWDLMRPDCQLLVGIQFSRQVSMKWVRYINNIMATGLVTDYTGRIPSARVAQYNLYLIELGKILSSQSSHQAYLYLCKVSDASRYSPVFSIHSSLFKLI